MRGRAAVARQRQKLDITFSRARGLAAAPELHSDFARYLCIRVSGFVEQATIALLIEFVRVRSDPKVVRHVEGNVRRLSNLNAQRLIDVVGALDREWRRELEAFIVGEYKDALDAIVSLRNAVAHGRDVNVSWSHVNDHYTRVKRIIDRVADLLVPRQSRGGA